MNHATYLAHARMDAPGRETGMLGTLPSDPEKLVLLVQNALIHQHTAKWAHGVELEAERARETWLRSVEEKLAWLRSHGYRDLADPHAPADRMVGICRDYSVLGTALFRAAGIPARARCGFATYFEPGVHMDHWVIEWWNEARGDWQLTDAQMDPETCHLLKLPFDPMDVPRDAFLTGPVAWLRARSGQADPKSFGIFTWWGYEYLCCNLLLDVNALDNTPMQPWDGWAGYKMSTPDTWSEEDWRVLDNLAQVAENVDGDPEGFRHCLSAHPGIRVPEDWSLVLNFNDCPKEA